MLAEAALGAAGAAGLLAWAVRGRSAAVFGSSVWRGPRSVPAIALTFDDGPSESTPELLAVLAESRARATFFQCGVNVQRLPEVARQVADAGHEIGNHSQTHPMFCFRSRLFLHEELLRAQDSIEHATAVRPVLFRAPYGVRWLGLGAVQRELGLAGVMWTAIGLDWKHPAGRVAARLLRAASNGAILCLHDGRELSPRPDIGAAIEAVRRLVPELMKRGYRLVTVSELLAGSVVQQ